MKARKLISMLLTLALLLGMLPVTALSEDVSGNVDAPVPVVDEYIIGEDEEDPPVEENDPAPEPLPAQTVTYTFIANEVVVETQVLGVDGEIEKPEDPAAPEGYVFAGWYIGEELLFADDDGDGVVDPEYVFAEDGVTEITVVAAFEMAEENAAEEDAAIDGAENAAGENAADANYGVPTDGNETDVPSDGGDDQKPSPMGKVDQPEAETDEVFNTDGITNDSATSEGDGETTSSVSSGDETAFQGSADPFSLETAHSAVSRALEPSQGEVDGDEDTSDANYGVPTGENVSEDASDGADSQKPSPGGESGSADALTDEVETNKPDETDGEATSSVSPNGEPASPQGEASGNDIDNTDDEETSSVSPDGDPASPQGEAAGDKADDEETSSVSSNDETASPEGKPFGDENTESDTDPDAENQENEESDLDETQDSLEEDTDATEEGPDADDQDADDEAAPLFPAFCESVISNGVVITVTAPEGVFPEGAWLSVMAIPQFAQAAQAADAAIEDIRNDDQNVAVSYTFDITVLDAEGNELEPAEGSAVQVSFALAEVADQNLETNVYHVTEDEETGALTAEALEVSEAGDTATATTDGFSLYTVEFTYNSLEYVLEGGEAVALSAILAKLGIAGEPDDADDAVTVSDAALFTATRQPDGWVVESLRPFSSVEWMVVRVGGIPYQITVTDDQQGGYFVVGNITDWAIDSAYRMTITGNAEYDEYVMRGVALTTQSQFKVVYSQNGTSYGGDDMYPYGWGNNYGENGEITADGSYDIYFRRNGDGGNGWFYSLIYVTPAQHKHDDITFQKWESTNSLPTSSGDYYLTADVTLSDKWKVPTGVTRICLNGHTIDTGTNYIYLNSGKTLEIYEHDGQNGKITSSDKYAVLNEGAFALHGGTIQGKGIDNYDDAADTGVYIDRGSFTMTGGAITGFNDSGVIMGGGTFNVSGAPAISHNVNEEGASDVLVHDGQTITVAGPLSNTEKIGVRMDIPGTFTTGWKDNMGDADPAKYFASEVNNYVVTLDADGEAMLAEPEWAPLQAAINAAADGATIKLDSSIDKNGDGYIRALATDGALTINSSKNITLDLNGCTLDRGSPTGVDANNRVLLVNGKLTVQDSGTTTTGKITGGVGGVYVQSGDFTLAGGAITGNPGTKRGGGVAVTNGSFTMTGGEISGNACGSMSFGGGVYVAGSTFTMRGGKITLNSAVEVGGVYMTNTSDTKLIMEGGEITDNTADSYAGGVNVGMNAKFSVKGKVDITGNVVGGTLENGVYTGGTANNVFLTDGATIAVAGALEDGADIAVSMATPGVFTSGGSFPNLEKVRNFFSSDDGCEVNLSHSVPGEATLAVAEVVNGQGVVKNCMTLQDAFDECKEPAGNTIYLLTEVQTNQTINAGGGTTTLDLNGYGILMTGNGSALNVPQGVALTLTDSDPNTTHYITLENGRGTKAESSGTASATCVKVSGGYITGGNADYGGGVYVISTLNMEDGTIIGNTASKHGGGVYVAEGGAFDMTGGAITGNSAGTSGGGVFPQRGGTLSMSDVPTVTGNTAGGKDNNFYLQSGMTIGSSGQLNEDARIGVTTEVKPTGGAFVPLTNGYKANAAVTSPGRLFISDDTTYAVGWNENKTEAVLGVPVKASATDYDAPYDGQAHGIAVTVTEPKTGATICYSHDEANYSEEKIEYTTAQDATTVYYRVSAPGYLSAYGSATVKIDPIDATVKIKGTKSTATYDGEAHTAEEFDIEPSTPLYMDNDFTFTGFAEASRTDVGTTQMHLDAKDFQNISPNFKNVTFVIVEDGSQTIKPAPVTVTITGDIVKAVYDGQEHVAEDYTATASSKLYDLDEDMDFDGDDEAARTEVGTTSMGLNATQFENDNENFKVTFVVNDGYVEIAPAAITITAADKSSAFGAPLQDLTYAIGGAYVEGDPLGVTLTTTATAASAVGEYPITVAWKENKNYTATLVNGNYTITNGGLTVSASGYSGTYDGQPHGITVTVKEEGASIYYATTKLTAENCATAGSKTPVTRTDAGKTTVYYCVVGANREAVTGSKDVEITKKALTVVADDLTKTEGDVDPELTYTKTGLVGTDALTGALARDPGETVGTYNITQGTLMASDNYAIAFTGGKLTISARPQPAPEPQPQPEPEPVQQPEPQPVIAPMLVGTVVSVGPDALQVAWMPVEGAQGYDVFMAECGSKTFALVQTVLSGSPLIYTATGLETAHSYKFYTKAWKMVDGVKTYIDTSPTAHAIAGDVMKGAVNPASVSVEKADMVVKLGKKAKIHASVTGVANGKLLKHEKKLRYYSSDRKVATVSKKGKVKAVGPGTCTIYVVANNGAFATVNVKVDASPDWIKLRKVKKPVKAGDTLDLSRRVILSHKKAETSLTWISETPDIATVDASGIVTAITPGEAIITVITENEKTATRKIKVE